MNNLTAEGRAAQQKPADNDDQQSDDSDNKIVLGNLNLP